MSPAEAEAVASRLGTRLISFEPLIGGFSHETCLLNCSDGRIVVRFGGGQPAIEVAVMQIAGDNVPVPDVYMVQPHAYENHRPYIALEFVDAVLLQDIIFKLDRSELRPLANELGAMAGRIGHRKFQRPGFFTDAQLSVSAEAPWSGQLESFALDSIIKTNRLSAGVGDAWVRLCASHAADLREIDDWGRLVHGDMNTKNVLVRKTPHAWRVAAILDWEFAYSGCPYGDPANMSRFEADCPEEFLEQFRLGFAEESPELSPNWLHIGRVLDMFALSALITRPTGHEIADRAADVIGDWVSRGIPQDR